MNRILHLLSKGVARHICSLVVSFVYMCQALSVLLVLIFMFNDTRVSTELHPWMYAISLIALIYFLLAANLTMCFSRVLWATWQGVSVDLGKGAMIKLSLLFPFGTVLVAYFSSYRIR